MRGFGENLADGDERETQRETERDEGEFIGPNPPSGRRTKNEIKLKYKAIKVNDHL